MVALVVFLGVVALIGLAGLGLMLAGARYHGSLERYPDRERQRRREQPATLEGGSSHLRSYGGSD